MKEYTLLERVVMILKVIISIVSWVSKILIKIVRGMLPGAGKSKAVASTTPRADNAGTPTT